MEVEKCSPMLNNCQIFDLARSSSGLEWFFERREFHVDATRRQRSQPVDQALFDLHALGVGRRTPEYADAHVVDGVSWTAKMLCHRVPR